MDTAAITALFVASFLLGLKHATEPDHLAAVSTIVSERKSIWSAAIVGGLWGIGHTISLVAAGILVIFLHFQIGERLALVLEFCVALMLIGLGINALRKAIRGAEIHFHTHKHNGVTHTHIHTHDKATSHSDEKPHPHEHELPNLSLRPLVVGIVHGLAGSGALMLLILSTISSTAVGIAYILIFGAGSIGGMVLMSMLVGLPFHLSLNRIAWADWLLRGAAGTFSLCFGLFMVYDIGVTQELFYL